MELLPAISAYGTSTVNVTTMDGTYNHIISTQGTSSMCSYHRRMNCFVFYHERNIFSHIFYYTEQLLCVLPWTEHLLARFYYTEQLLCVLPWTEHLLTHLLLHGAIALCSTMNRTSSHTFSITRSNCSVFYHKCNIFSHIVYYTSNYSVFYHIRNF